MIIDYSKFKYVGSWIGDIELIIEDKPVEIGITLDGDETRIAEAAKEALEWYLENRGSMREELLSRILDYYCDERESLGYDIEENEEYPLVSDISEISRMISLVAINIPDQKMFKKGVFLIFECSWDKENGVGVRIVDEKIAKVDYQDIAL